jgi:hypothetical protein
MPPGIINGVVQPGYDHRGRYYGTGGGRETHIYVHDDASVMDRVRAGTRRIRDRLVRDELPNQVSGEESAADARRRAEPGPRRQDRRRDADPDEECEGEDANPFAAQKFGVRSPDPRDERTRGEQFKTAVDRHYRGDRRGDARQRYRDMGFTDQEAEGLASILGETTGDPPLAGAPLRSSGRVDLGPGEFGIPRGEPEPRAKGWKTSGGYGGSSEQMTAGASARDQAHRQALIDLNASNRARWKGKAI